MANGNGAKTKNQLVKELDRLPLSAKELESLGAEGKWVEEALKKSDQEKTTILNSLSELVIFQDFEHRVLWCNKTASESVGLPPEKLVGRYCYEIWGRGGGPCLGCPVAKARQTGKPKAGEITTPDGKVWLIKGYPIRDGSGKVTSMVELALEITQHKQAEDALQEEKNKLQSLIGAMGFALTIYDKDYNIIYQNEASQLTTSGSCVGEKCYKVYENRDTACEGCPVKEAFGDGKSYTMERQRTLPSGEITFWENTASPIRDAEGKIVSCLEIGVDITQHKQAEEKLRDEATRHRILIDESSDGIVILDEKGKVYEANKRFAEMLGYTPEEALKLSVLDWDAELKREQLAEMIANVGP